MKVIFIKKKSIFKIIGVILALLVIIFLAQLLMENKTKETFKNNEDVFYKGNIDKKTIAFTCNVDWGNEYIPSMLDIFKKNDIKITFFVTGRWADKNKDLLLEIYNQGHEIGNHGYLHRDYSNLGYSENKKEISKTDDIIENILNINSDLFAPPSGAYNEFTVKAANDLDYKVIMWSIDTIDWRKDSSADKIINRVISKVHNSAIVLMHPKEETIKALPTIITSLKKQGYDIGRVSDIIK